METKTNREIRKWSNAQLQYKPLFLISCDDQTGCLSRLQINVVEDAQDLQMSINSLDNWAYFEWLCCEQSEIRED